MSSKVAVIAIGGNSLIKDKEHLSVQDQYSAARETCEHIAHLIKHGWDVVVSHGNGPQVGFIMRRSELAAHRLHEIPMDVVVADTQGAIGYALQQNLYNFLKQLGVNKPSVTVVTQVEVDRNDPAFNNPTKPIGRFMSEDRAMRRRADQGWDVIEDAGRGWRRAVPSPLPMRIIEESMIKNLISAGVVVIAIGGGGIPVVTDDDGNLTGVAAVIDKDHTSALLANRIGAELLIISTGVEKVALNFGKPNQTWLDHISLADIKTCLAEGTHFASGSMAPKIQAVINYLENGGGKAIITNPKNIERAVAGETGTHITV